MAQVLYRKYRSRKFPEVIGQEHITSTLSKAIESGKISHAYLFTGPRGVGKTSVARIMAHEINGLPYRDDSTHLDIIEIDAASNRRIDEVRELRDKLHNAPAAAQYKVYIVDEAHMLTREAFNALLKTLEEPPDHVVFILATTEAHKLPETIVSRTQRFTFKPIPKDAIVKHLQTIVKAEGIKADEQALELIADHGHGSFRDSISLLDQLSASGHAITLAETENMLGLPDAAAVDKLADKIMSYDAAGSLRELQALREQAVNPVVVASQLSSNLRARLIEGESHPRLPELLRQLLDVPSALNPSELLELAILEACLITDPTVEESRSSKPPSTGKGFKQSDNQTGNNKPLAGLRKLSAEDWQAILNEVRDKSSGLYTALRLADPKIVDNELLFRFQFPLHQKKILQLANLEIIHLAVRKILGHDVAIKAVVDKDIASDITPESSPTAAFPSLMAIPAADTEAISSIFGSVEVLES